MNLVEKFQSFCRYCSRVSEADSAAEAIRRTEEHEKACPYQPKPGQLTRCPRPCTRESGVKR
jgi:hypothetical protein